MGWIFAQAEVAELKKEVKTSGSNLNFKLFFNLKNAKVCFQSNLSKTLPPH